MQDFSSTLILQTRSKKELTLPNTAKIILLDSPFTVQHSPFPKYILTHSGAIDIYRLKPFSRVDSFTYKNEVTDLVLIGRKLVTLSEDVVIVSGKGSRNQMAGKFAHATLGSVHGHVGVQDRGTLRMHSLETLQPMKEYKCNSHFCLRDVLVTAREQELCLYRRGVPLLKLFMPDRITRLCCDPLLSNIYCGTSNGSILNCSLSHKDPSVMAYHTAEIVGLDLSFCGRFLYSADASGVVCVWDTASGVVVGKTKVDEPVKKLAAVYASEWSGEDDPFLL
jgi:WD40 repeat protein